MFFGTAGGVRSVKVIWVVVWQAGYVVSWYVLAGEASWGGSGAKSFVLVRQARWGPSWSTRWVVVRQAW